MIVGNLWIGLVMSLAGDGLMAGWKMHLGSGKLAMSIYESIHGSQQGVLGVWVNAIFVHNRARSRRLFWMYDTDLRS